MSKNLGRAAIKVELLENLPNITKDLQRYQFDINAAIWNTLKQSKRFTPFLVEHITDGGEDKDATFGAIFPQRRKAYLNNYMIYGDGTSNADNTEPFILWKPVKNLDGIVYDLTKELPNYSSIQTGDYSTAPADYIGPEWVDAVVPKPAPPKDGLALRLFVEALTQDPNSSKQPTTTTTTTTETPLPEPELHIVNQRKVRDGLWWEIESTSFLSENMPFWVEISRAASPASNDTETSIVLQMGLGDNKNAFDLYLSDRKPAMVIEYPYGRREGTNDGDGPYFIKSVSFEDEGAILSANTQNITIGVMTIGGRLVFFVNDSTLIYTRYHGAVTQQSNGKEEKPTDGEPGELKEAKIAAGKIRLFGTNVQVSLLACPMTFAEVGAIALDGIVPVIPPQTEGSGETVEKDYVGVNEELQPIKGRTVAQLPKEDGSRYFGCDCDKFYDANGVASPEGFGFHQNGVITFKRSTELGVTSWGSDDFYIMLFYPGILNGGGELGYNIVRGGSPYFVKLKGAVRMDGESKDTDLLDISDDVIDMSETTAAEDIYFVKKSASVTLYNKGGVYDYLKTNQKGIRLSWGWDDGSDATLTQTFTGLIVAASTSEVAGKETITLDCKDYAFILENTPIINSPIYDGMIMFYAAEDIANRAGITEVINDWTSDSGNSEDEYFLPSGYTFSQPLVHFDQKQMLWEGLIYMLQRPEAFGYFDEEGKLHIKKIPGGLFSDTGKSSISASFTRASSDPDYMILDERSVMYDYNPTVNNISVLSLDKDTREAIVYNTKAKKSEDILKYKRVYLHDNPALGDYDVVVSHAQDLAQRIYFPIRKTSFKTVGSVSTLNPFDFVTVDGDEYRLMSLTRKYSIDSNDFTNEYNTEWLGGA